MSGPERIWAYPSYVTGWNSANAHDRFIVNSTEYIRADLVQSLIQAAQDLDRQFCDDDLGPSAMAMGKLREAYMRIK